MSFNLRLKERRKALNLSRIELADSIGITSSAIANYENGISMPKIELLYKLFQALDCDANYLYQDEMSNLEVDFKVQTIKNGILDKFDSLDIYGKKLVESVIDIELERVNAQAQRRSEAQKEQPQQFTVLEPPRVIPSYQGITSVSAGTGQYVFDNLIPDMVEVDNDCNADFVIDVCGDSMLPTYNDGDGLLVKRQDTVNVGEIGIFMVNNEAYVKECGGDRLISHNKKYPDILLKEHQDIRCIGKVIGKLD